MSGTTWVILGILTLVAVCWIFQWWNFRTVLGAKDDTINSYHKIIEMQRATLTDLVHGAWPQTIDKRGTRVLVELDAATWQAIHRTTALSAIILSKPTDDQGETNGP